MNPVHTCTRLSNMSWISSPNLSLDESFPFQIPPVSPVSQCHKLPSTEYVVSPIPSLKHQSLPNLSMKNHRSISNSIRADCIVSSWQASSPFDPSPPPPSFLSEQQSNTSRPQERINCLSHSDQNLSDDVDSSSNRSSLMSPSLNSDNSNSSRTTLNHLPTFFPCTSNTDPDKGVRPRVPPITPITPFLFLGCEEVANDITTLSDIGITHVLSLVSHAPQNLNTLEAVVYRHLPLHDTLSANILSLLPIAMDFIGKISLEFIFQIYFILSLHTSSDLSYAITSN
jgi:hypothetical protein